MSCVRRSNKVVDREHLRKMERSLAEDWRNLKNLLDQDTITDQHAEKVVNNLNTDIILEEGKSLKELDGNKELDQ